MKEILDQAIEEKQPGSLFAKLAFATAMITLCLIGFAVMIPSKAQPSFFNPTNSIQIFSRSFSKNSG